jgi:hypothetical protein
MARGALGDIPPAAAAAASSSGSDSGTPVNGFENDGKREWEPVLRCCGDVGADTVNDWKGDLVVAETGEMGDVAADEDEAETDARVEGRPLVVVIVGGDMKPPAWTGEVAVDDGNASDEPEDGGC